MKTKLIRFKAGFTNVFLLKQGERAMLVDTGTRGYAERLIRIIKAKGVNPSQLKFIFLTHSHYDHAGSVASLKDLTGAEIMIHSNEAANLREGFTPIPKGVNWFFKGISAMGHWERNHRRIASYPPAEAAITIDDFLPLSEYGFDAEIIHTPGHTMGSCSLLAENYALVGDCMFNMFGSLYPGFANDEAILKQSWQKLLKLDVEYFYPSHGRPVSMKHFRRQAKKIGVK